MCGDILECVGIFSGVWEYSRVCEDILGCVRIFSGVWEYSQLKYLV